MLKILSYLGLLLLTFTYTYIFDVKENYVLLYMLIMIPIIDYFIFIYIKKSINVDFNIDKEEIEKGQEVTCTLEFTNTSFIPISISSFDFLYNDKFYINDDDRRLITLLPKKTITINYKLLSVYRGEGQINLEDISLKSLFGFYIDNITPKNTMFNVLITPAIVEISGVEKLNDLKDSDTDDIENFYATLSGEPGYEYKVYNPGDPLNRINWKLSSKSKELLIRKSLSTIKRKKVLIIDPVISNEAKFEELGDLFIEGTIGILKGLYEKDYEVSLYYMEGKNFKFFNYNGSESLAYLKNTFSYYTFQKRLSSRFAKLSIQDNESMEIMILTTNIDNEIKSLEIMLKDKGHLVTTINNNKKKTLENEVYLSKTFTLEVL